MSHKVSNIGMLY